MSESYKRQNPHLIECIGLAIYEDANSRKHTAKSINLYYDREFWEVESAAEQLVWFDGGESCNRCALGRRPFLPQDFVTLQWSACGLLLAKSFNLIFVEEGGSYRATFLRLMFILIKNVISPCSNFL